MSFLPTLSLALFFLAPMLTPVRATDATFNGLATAVHCQASNLTLCSKDNYCVDASRTFGGLWVNYWIFLDRRAISSSTPGRRNGMPIQIQEISKVQLNKVLFVKFSYAAENNAPVKAMIVLVPDGRGGYELTFASQTALNVAPSDAIAESGLSAAINSGRCTIRNDATW